MRCKGKGVVLGAARISSPDRLRILCDACGIDMREQLHPLPDCWTSFLFFVPFFPAWDVLHSVVLGNNRHNCRRSCH